jgi:sulfatase maturation enzyme AslB (radical SAM superfamily)
MFRINHPNNCFSCFAMLYIRPTKQGFADISTCCTHIDKKSNRLIIPEGISRAWNHRVFLRQRKLVLNNNWSFCYGNKCMPFRIYPDFERICLDKDIQNALGKGLFYLSYLPKALWITTSYACNNNCPFCYQKMVQADREQFKLNHRIILELKRELIPQAKQIVFTGGEPLLNDIGLIRFVAGNYPQIKLGIGTNGILLNRYGIEQIVKDKIHLTISVYGFEEKLYNRLTRSNNYKIFMNNLNQLIKKGYGQSITLDYMVYDKETLANLSKFLEFIRKNPNLSAIVRDNHWGDTRYQNLILEICNNNFSDILNRVKLYMRGEKKINRFFNKVYSRIYDLKTVFLKR